MKCRHRGGGPVPDRVVKLWHHYFSPALIPHSIPLSHTLLQGRMFDWHVFDMMELGVDEEGFQSLRSLSGPKKAFGAPPCMIFSGDAWDRVSELGRLRNIILDVFGATDITMMSLRGIDHVICLTASGYGSASSSSSSSSSSSAAEDDDGAAAAAASSSSTSAASAPTIYWRTYYVELKKSGSKVPRVELVAMGPNMDLTLRRSKAPAADLEKEAHRIPAA